MNYRAWPEHICKLCHYPKAGAPDCMKPDCDLRDPATKPDRREKICVSKLSPEQKRAVWEHMKKTDPAQAEILQNDAFVKSMRDVFGAAPLVSREFINEAMKG